MPCPYFEPRNTSKTRTYPNARLPLIEEYDGVCHAAGEPRSVPEDVRLPYCNHGYSRGACPQFPVVEACSAVRFTFIKAAARDEFEIMWIKEHDHAPESWQIVWYFLDGSRLEPEIPDACLRAQVIAFCSSYRKRFMESL